MKRRTHRRKTRRRYSTQPAAFRSDRLGCAACGVQLQLTFVEAGGEFFCSETHAEEFFRDLNGQPAQLEPGNGLNGGSHGCFEIEPGIAVSRYKKGGFGDA